MREVRRQKRKKKKLKNTNSKIHAITDKKCNERGVNGKNIHKLEGSKIINGENGYYGIKCQRVKLGIHFDRMRQTKHFLTPIINNCIQFKMNKS
jgi:hypothetical protein